jgi:surface protein
MKKLIGFLAIASLYTCSQDNLSEVLGENGSGTVRLSVKLDQSFAGGNGADSPWVHTYQSEATVTFTSTTSVFTKSVTFDPNDLANFPATSLPYGDYNWSVAQTGDDVAVSSVLYVYGSSSSPFTVDSPTVSMPLVLDTDFALVTVSATDLSSASIRQNGVNTALTIQDGYYYGYINSNFTGFTLNIVTTESFGGADTIASPVANTHYNYAINYQQFADTGVTLELSSTFVLENRGITAGLDEDLDGVLDTDDLCPGTRSGAPVDANGCLDVIELDANGVTIKAKPGAAAGDQQDLNGVSYTVVDETMLRSMVANDEDVTKVVTTLVTNMGYLFFEKRTFNLDISSWDTSNVTNLAYAFYENPVFNQDISFWNVSNVTNMRGLFQVASSFNQDLSSWDTSEVTDMFATFGGTEFNLNIGGWDTSKVTIMAFAFEDCSVSDLDISSWNVSNVTDFSWMFHSSAFNGNLNNWDISSATDLSYMFFSSNFNQDISNWNTSNVENMNNMFNNNIVFNQPIGEWDVSKVLDMSAMFIGARDFNQPIDNWNVQNVLSFASMFQEARSFNQDISSWDVAQANNMFRILWYADSFNQDLSNWNVSNVEECSEFSVNATAWTLPKPNFTYCTE